MYTIVCIEKNILLPLNIEGESQSEHINKSVFMMCLVGGGGVHGLSQKNNQIVVSADYHILLTWIDTNQPNEAAELQISNAMPLPPLSLLCFFCTVPLFQGKDSQDFWGDFPGCFEWFVTIEHPIGRGLR